MSQALLSDPMVPRPFKVRHARRELPGVATLELLPVDGPMPRFLAGQFNMLYAFGIGEIAISISGDPSRDDALIHTVRDVGAVSRAIMRAGAGTMLGVRGPYGTAWPTSVAEGSDVLIVAGGLGLAPLRPAIYEVLANRARYHRVAILYGTRSPSEILFRTELERWRKRLDVEVMVTVDHADASWHGDVGVVPKLVSRAGFDPAETVAMVCGPEVMMRFTAIALIRAGMPAEKVYVSMERNMKCAIGLCGHCQFGPDFVCKDGAVMRYDRIAERLAIREI